MNRDSLVLSSAMPSDLSVLLELEDICSPHPWNASAFGAALRAQSGSCALVIRKAGRSMESEIIAFCVFQTAADELHIHKLCVHPQKRRRGLGRLLIKSALSLGARRGARRAVLEVRAGNTAALRLYAALGFQSVARRGDYYLQPVEDALVMEKRVGRDLSLY
ncbi:MAG: ribosomal protein S18-alanine N-acetyltransferase [Vicinamibacteria bacterium]|nr:ribosomal protein S18-alanine N-acetyltransferase [Vicinamibacteria bacterium]